MRLSALAVQFEDVRQSDVGRQRHPAQDGLVDRVDRGQRPRQEGTLGCAFGLRRKPAEPPQSAFADLLKPADAPGIRQAWPEGDRKRRHTVRKHKFWDEGPEQRRQHVSELAVRLQPLPAAVVSLVSTESQQKRADPRKLPGGRDPVPVLGCAVPHELDGTPTSGWFRAMFDILARPGTRSPWLESHSGAFSSSSESS